MLRSRLMHKQDSVRNHRVSQVKDVNLGLTNNARRNMSVGPSKRMTRETTDPVSRGSSITQDRLSREPANNKQVDKSFHNIRILHISSFLVDPKGCR